MRQPVTANGTASYNRFEQFWKPDGVVHRSPYEVALYPPLYFCIGVTSTSSIWYVHTKRSYLVLNNYHFLSIYSSKYIYKQCCLVWIGYIWDQRNRWPQMMTQAKQIATSFLRTTSNSEYLCECKCNETMYLCEQCKCNETMYSLSLLKEK